MKVVVKCMGIPFEGLEKWPIELDLEDGATIEDMVQRLMKMSPVLTPKHFDTTSFMINQNNANSRSTLHEGDKVLLMRILGGG